VHQQQSSTTGFHAKIIQCAALPMITKTCCDQTCRCLPAFAVTFMLGIFFVSRFARTKKVFPAGKYTSSNQCLLAAYLPGQHQHVSTTHTKSAGDPCLQVLGPVCPCCMQLPMLPLGCEATDRLRMICLRSSKAGRSAEQRDYVLPGVLTVDSV
jgi:hypothetical protein